MLTENFLRLSTPSAQRLLAFAKTLDSNSYETFVITKSRVSLKSEKMKVVNAVSKKEIPLLDPILLFLYFIKSLGVMRRHKIRLIISTVPKINNAIVGFLLSKLFKVPHIIDIRDYWESQLLSYPMNRFFPKRLVSLLIDITSFLYSQASSLTTVNETLKKMLVKRGIPYNRIYIIPNGADTSLYRPCEDKNHVKKLRKKYGLPLSKMIFVYGGALSPHNRFDIVLDGIASLRKTEDLLFLIIGRPTFLMTNDTILKWVETLGLRQTVKVAGPFPLEEAAEIFSCSDVGVIPLDNAEIWKHMITAKVFAYLASGLPILASGPNQSELEKFLASHKVGVFIGPPSPMSFADGFRKFLRERRKMKNMGRKGREVMEERFDRHVLSRRILRVAHSVTSQHSGKVQLKDARAP